MNMKRLLRILGIIVMSEVVWIAVTPILTIAQSFWPPPIISTADPAGGCANGRFWVNVTTSTVWTCAGSAWISLSGSGGAVPSVVVDKGGQVFNVKAYGAKGDGVTDDTAAIQAAVTAAQAAGGEVWVPPGVFKLTGTIAITGHVTIAGSRVNSTTAGSVLQFTGTGGGACSAGTNGFIQMQVGSLIDGVVLDATNNSAGTCMVNISTPTSSEVSHPQVYNSNIVCGGTSSTNLGIYSLSTDSVYYVGNIIQNCAQLIYADTSHNFVNAVIENNILSRGTDNTKYMVAIPSNGFSFNLRVVGNTWEGYGSSYAFSGSSIGGFYFANNWMGDSNYIASSTAVTVSGTGPCTVANNDISFAPTALNINCNRGGTSIHGNLFAGHVVLAGSGSFRDNVVNPATGGTTTGVGIQYGAWDVRNNYFPSTITNSFTAAAGSPMIVGYTGGQDSSTNGPVAGTGLQVLYGNKTNLTFSTYRACSSVFRGSEILVSDSTTATHGGTITGGGANFVKGLCDGTNWVVEYP